MSQKGRTMLETLLVLAIIGVLTVGALMGYRWALRKHMANQAVKYIQTVAVGGRTFLNTKIAGMDFSNEGLDAQVESNNLGITTETYANFPLYDSPTENSRFDNKLILLDNFVSNVPLSDDKKSFKVFENAVVSAMVTDDNDIVVNVEKMTINECKQLIASNVDADEIKSLYFKVRYVYRCSENTFSDPETGKCQNEGGTEISLSQLADIVCQAK